MIRVPPAPRINEQSGGAQKKGKHCASRTTDAAHPLVSLTLDLRKSFDAEAEVPVLWLAELPGRPGPAPFHKAECISPKQAADIAGKSKSTMPAWPTSTGRADELGQQCRSGERALPAHAGEPGNGPRWPAIRSGWPSGHIMSERYLRTVLQQNTAFLPAFHQHDRLPAAFTDLYGLGPILAGIDCLEKIDAHRPRKPAPRSQSLPRHLRRDW